MTDPASAAVTDRAPILAIMGPTASGKSSLAVAVARHLGERGAPAEIVNADSMVVYRGMDIGTASPPGADRAAVRHHLVDIWDITTSATVAEFQQLARAAIADCRDRGVVPIVVGGSSLYMRAILDVFEFPGTDPVVRARLEGELEHLGAAAMHARLQQVDPRAAEGIEPGNGRRIVRALEVIELTGSYTARLPDLVHAAPPTVQVGLRLGREVLDARIAARVEQMWADGFVEEVRRLAADGLAETRTASRALGYRQVLQYLAGELGEDEARERTISGTRRFARKQFGWFRRDPRITWLDARADTTVLVEQVAATEVVQSWVARKAPPDAVVSGTVEQ